MSEYIVCGSLESDSHYISPHGWTQYFAQTTVKCSSCKLRLPPMGKLSGECSGFARSCIFVESRRSLVLIVLLYLFLPPCLFCMWPVKLCKCEWRFSHGSNLRFVWFNLVLFKLELYPAHFYFLHNSVIRALWGHMLTVSCRNFSLRGSWAQGEENKTTSSVIILAPFAQLPAEWGDLYYCFSMRSISEVIFSFPSNLSRNIKDSLTTVNLRLILEWYSDASHYSFMLKWIHTLLCLSLSWIESIYSYWELHPMHSACDETLINLNAFCRSSKIILVQFNI